MDIVSCKRNKRHYNKDFHRVCIVDADGEVKQSFGGKNSSDVGGMNIPNYLVVDKERFVLVADRINNRVRVLLLSPDLKFVRKILSKSIYSLQHTTRILLNESSAQLLIVENGL